MSKNKEVILAKVKYEVLERLFMMGDLTHPDKLTKTITDVMEQFNEQQFELYQNRDLTYKDMFKFNKCKTEDYPTFKRESDFISAIRSRKIKDVNPLVDDNTIVSMWNKIQDVRTILHLKCMAKHSQSNNVMADQVTVITAQRVLNNQQEYLNL